MTRQDPSQPEILSNVRPVVCGYGPPPEGLDDDGIDIDIDISELRLYVSNSAEEVA